MAYPNLLYRGQYTLKRVLTMPADPSLTSADVDKLVSVDANGVVILATGNETFFGVLRTVNANDNICTVDFSGVHEFTASGAIKAGDRVQPSGNETVKVLDTTDEATTAVALTKADVAGDKIAIFFLN